MKTRRPGEDEVWRLGPVVRGRDARWDVGGKGGGASRSPSLSPNAIARLSRIVNKTPEVTVKVTGRSRGVAHLKKHLDYITRHGQLSGVTQNGQTIKSRDNLRALHDSWIATNDLRQRGRAMPNGAHAVSLVLSMPPGTDPDKLEVAAHAWATETFKGTHDWIMVRHDDTKHPHCHVTVRAVGYDGKRLAPGPADLQSWRNEFASQLRRQGIAAEATPRQARGVTRKGLSLPAQKIAEKLRASPSTARPRPPLKPIVRPPASTVRKWTSTIEARAEGIKKAYLTHAEALSQGGPADRQLARDIERFVAQMPVAAARRPALADELEKVARARPGSTPAPATKPDNRPPAPAPAKPAPTPSPRPKGPKL